MEIFKLFGSIFVNNDEANKSIAKTGQEAEKSGGILSKMGGIASAAGKALAVGAAAAGTAFVALATGSVKAYAEYEQLVGGVETLFGKSSDVVLKYAEEAYKTAGLSANQYMETITGFSASLLQGLGGDTEKAAEIGNMAVTDMADNANKMGTAIGSIQNAYQGFAKQNFTMLDNLKLGYGGTAAEMARLINDSGVLGDSFEATAENVKGIPFDQMVEAIHAIQVEMDITGTTAKEASATISGSWSALKSSWANVLTSLASDNKEFFRNSITALTSTADTFVGNVMGAVTNVVEGFGQLASGVVTKVPELFQNLLPAVLTGAETLLNSVIDALPAMMDVFTDVLPMIAEAILRMLPSMLKAGIEVLTTLVQGIAKTLPDLIPVAVDAVITLVETLIDNIDMLIDAAVAITIALAEGLIKALPVLMEKAPVILGKLVNAIIDNAPKLLEAALQLILKLGEGIIIYMTHLPKYIGEVMDVIVGAFGNLIGDIVEVGKNLIMGLWNGIKDKVQWLKDKVVGVVDTIKGWFTGKDGFDSHSPSVWAEKVAGFVGEGLGNGFIKSTAKAVEGAKVLVTGVQNVLGGIVETAETAKEALLDVFAYDPTVDYMNLINEAIEAGDIRTARALEATRNAKIQGLGLADYGTTDMFSGMDTLSGLAYSTPMDSYAGDEEQRTISDVVLAGLADGFAMVSDTILDALPDVLQFSIDSTLAGEALFKGMDRAARRNGTLGFPTRSQIEAIARSVMT